MRARRLLLAALVTVSVVAGGCSTELERESGATPEVAMPVGLAAYVDQSRLGRQSGAVFVRLVNDTDHELTVIRAAVSSPRYDTSVWTGDKTFVNEADLDLTLPRTRCGQGADAEVRLTYRLDGGPLVVSMTTATDRYGQVALLLDRDCAQQTLAEASDLSVGPPRIDGTGRDSVFELPITLTPTGGRDDVSFAGFEDTVLFRQATGSASVDDARAYPLDPTGGPVDVLLRLVPTRCDPHALAEDKVGTLIGVRVVAPGLAPTASFYLPIADATRAELRGFFATHCGL